MLLHTVHVLYCTKCLPSSKLVKLLSRTLSWKPSLPLLLCSCTLLSMQIAVISALCSCALLSLLLYIFLSFWLFLLLPPPFPLSPVPSCYSCTSHHFISLSLFFSPLGQEKEKERPSSFLCVPLPDQNGRKSCLLIRLWHLPNVFRGQEGKTADKEKTVLVELLPHIIALQPPGPKMFIAVMF